jgi:hypothetical protein
VVVPVFPLILGLSGSTVATLSIWYACLPKLVKDQVNRATIYAAQREFGKAADELRRDEATIIVEQVATSHGAPIAAA